MARPAPSQFDEDTIAVPRAVRFPVELIPPDGFDPARLDTWPRVTGRLEWVQGRLLYMPPCGDRQQLTVSDLVTTLNLWCRSRPEYVVGTNEAGMLLGGDVRGADAAVWRRADLGPSTGGFWRVAPVLAVEVAGREELEPALRTKARWYLDAGVAVVWLLFPTERTVVVLTPTGESRHDAGGHLPPDPRLPTLTPHVVEFFRQVIAIG